MKILIPLKFQLVKVSYYLKVEYFIKNWGYLVKLFKKHQIRLELIMVISY